MVYTIGEMAKKLSLAPSTLRYYDKEGLLPFVERTDGGVRVFKEADYEWLKMIECLKKTGMKLSDIRLFVEMSMAGDSTVSERLALIIKQKEEVISKINELSETLKTLEFKEWYYKTAKEYGTTDVPRNMQLCDLPKEYREVRLKLRGK